MSSFDNSLFRSIAHFFKWVVWFLHSLSFGFLIYTGYYIVRCITGKDSFNLFVTLTCLIISLSVEKIFSFKKSYLSIVGFNSWGKGVPFLKSI